MSDVIATYLVHTEKPELALNAICRGQTVGNPTILTPFETKEFLKHWCATGKVLEDTHEGLYVMRVTFPQGNFGTEGVNYLMSVLLGGQCDVDVVQGCRLIDLDPGSQLRHWGSPRFGVTGIRRMLNVTNRAFVGGIIKPKIGLTPRQLADVVMQMADGGLDIIKEDEILADQSWCPMKDRLPLVAKALKGYNILYLTCITGDGSEVWQKARTAKKLGVNGIHVNLWSGLGTYLDTWRHVAMPMHFQKSGDKVWTTGNYSIDYAVLCQLVRAIGCDLAHVGMYGGYLAEAKGVLDRRIKALGPILPTFSCGLNPELAETIVRIFGTNVALLSGGWIHGQGSITNACQALRRAADRASQALGHPQRMVDRELRAISSANWGV